LDNYIALEEEPFEMFGKIMRMSDTVLREFYELATDVPMIEVDTMKFTDVAARDAKLRLAQEIVTLYHSKKTAQLAMGRWENTFVRDVAITDKARIVKNDLLEKNLRDMVVGMGLAKSKSETQRLFEQGGVLLDGVVEKNWRLSVVSFSKGNHTLTVGKKKQVITFTV
jgi:tyrosyl-tRNA synthetase